MIFVLLFRVSAYNASHKVTFLEVFLHFNDINMEKKIFKINFMGKFVLKYMILCTFFNKRMQ